MRPDPPTEPLRSKRNRRVQPSWTSAVARALAAALLIAQLPTATLAATPAKPSEYEVKAAYLLNFGKFVRRSTSAPAGSSFEICTLGHDPIGSSLDALADNSRINGLPVRITHLQDISAAKSCSIVFISATEDSHIREDLAILGDSDTLTVSDAPDFLERGGMIQFVLISNHVRFAVNLEPVNRTHLVLSSELLRVASTVSGKPPTGGLP
jgi:YfiR/HmsC-like